MSLVLCFKVGQYYWKLQNYLKGAMNVNFHVIYLYKGSATAVLGMFPAEYLGTMGSGMGIGGLIPSILNIAIIGASKNSAKVVGVACFCICTALAFSCLGLLFMLQKNTFYQFYANTISRDKKQLYDEVIFLAGV